MRRQFLIAGAVALSLILTGCTGQTAKSVEHNATPTATIYSTPTDTPTPQATDTPAPTATPAPPGSLPSGTPIDMTDYLGFTFSVQEQTISFSPTYTDPSSGFTYTAPPGFDMLDLHFVVRNLLTDRPLTFQLADFDAIGLYGACYDDGLPLPPKAPNGQCMANQSWVGWHGSVPDGYVINIPAGGSGEFDEASQYRSSFDVTTMTIWLDNCKGDGDIFDCSLTDSKIPLAGGVLLSPPTSG